MQHSSVPWLALFLLGALHGINPAMGWLFAVGRGLQERDRRALWGAFGPLALGHALAIGVAVLLAITLGTVLSLGWLRWIVCAALLVVGIQGLVRHRHVRLRGMRVNARELATWSFLMATVDGAGLMVLPFILGAAAPGPAGALHQHHAMWAAAAQLAPLPVVGMSNVDVIGVAAPLIHTIGYLVVTVLVAVVVYEKVGLRILRRAWVNLNVIW
ncbi:MAG: hypothetical protein ACRENC_18350, partial [Gemmatimonadaceae bacterium]